MSKPEIQDENIIKLVKELPPRAIVVERPPLGVGYQYKYTTGPFCLPQNTHSLDWGILNNDSSDQKVRVTVFKCHLGSIKTTEPPGPLEITLEPGKAIHNANYANGGFFYEIQVECNSKQIFPYAAAWPGAIGDPLPGTVINSADFIRDMD